MNVLQISLPTLLILTMGISVDPVHARPQRLCLEKDSDTIRIRRRCKAKKGLVELSLSSLSSSLTAQGPQGAQGEKGDKGEPGEKGEQGEKGDPGEPGSDASIEGVEAGGVLTGSFPNPDLANQVITPDNLTPLPGVKAYRGFPEDELEILNSSLRNIEFSSATTDTDGFTDLESNPSNIEIPRSGMYLLVAEVNWKTAPNGRLMAINRVGSANIAAKSFDADAGTHTQIVFLGLLEEGDVIRLSVFNSSGTSLTLNNNAIGGQANLALQWLSPL